MKIAITKVAWRQRSPWMVHYRPDGAAGAQKRFFYRTKQLAGEKKAQVAAEFLKDGRYGVLLLTSAEVREYREAKALAPGADLRDTARLWAKHEKRSIESPQLGDAAAHWKHTLEGLSARYLETAKVVERMVAEFGTERPVDAITAEEITALIDAMPLATETLANRRRMFGTFMGHCVRMGWRTDNPMVQVRRWRVTRGTPDFYSVTEVAEILRAVHEHEPRLVPAMALRFFAGVRTEELERIVHLGLEDDVNVKERRLVVRAEVAKGPRGAPRPRLVEDLPPVLWKWLALGPLVWPTHSARLVRTAIGDRVRRVPNGPRHTFATYAVAHYDSTEVVARKLGNSSAVALIHYMGVASQAAAKQFFGLDPKRVLGLEKRDESRKNRVEAAGAVGQK